MPILHIASTLSTSLLLVLGQLARGFRVRAERAATPPTCCRCGTGLDLVERRNADGRCFDCDVLALLNDHMLVHDYGVTQMVRAAA